MRFLFFAIIAFFLCTCSAVELGSADNKARDPEEPGKPSEDTEGVPGYLVDPAMVEVLSNDEGTKATLVGKTGSVVTEGKVSGYVTLTLHIVDATEFEIDHPMTDGKVNLAVLKQQLFLSNDDGSFSVEVEKAAGQIAILTTYLPTVETLLTVFRPENNAINAVFSDLAGSAPFQILRPQSLSSEKVDADISDESIPDAANEDAPPSLAKFSVLAGKEPGSLKFEIGYPADTSAYQEVEIRIKEGSTAPPDGCEDDGPGKVLSGPFEAANFNIKDLVPAGKYSVRVCIHGKNAQINGGLVREGVVAQNGFHISACRIMLTSCDSYCKTRGMQCEGVGYDANAANGQMSTHVACLGLLPGASQCNTVSQTHTARCRCL